MKKRNILLAVLPVLGAATIVGTGFSAWYFDEGSSSNPTASFNITQDVVGTAGIQVTHPGQVYFDDPSQDGIYYNTTVAGTDKNVLTIVVTPGSTSVGYASYTLSLKVTISSSDLLTYFTFNSTFPKLSYGTTSASATESENDYATLTELTYTAKILADETTKTLPSTTFTLPLNNDKGTLLAYTSKVQDSSSTKIKRTSSFTHDDYNTFKAKLVNQNLEFSAAVTFNESTND